ncbi:MAG TPA: hypothetical protein VNQ14_10560 [Woeseiaceae bacterium]|nr:hypothetical protein [Woeseiaceae bacterium]
MTVRTAFCCLIVPLLAGCASYEEGSYGPGCVAYAGNRIELDGGRFVWDKFTDQVLVNDAGEVVDQYPEYPLRGRYRLQGEALHFESYTGEPLPVMHLRREGSMTYLLTNKQLESLQNTGTRPECALVSGGAAADRR